MEIYFENEQVVSEELLALMEESARLCLEKEGIPEENCEFSVSFVDRGEIKELNSTYRDVDKVTDVLSFPFNEFSAPGNFDDIEENIDAFNPETGELLLGDIILSTEHILEQAKEYGHSKTRELAFLVVHSMLHLMGYDHMEDDERMVMEDRQRKILELEGISR